MKCRHCSTLLATTFANLGSAPASNAYLTTLNTAEKWYPLQVLVCANCWLVQTADYAEREELFTADYAYFSSYSSTWLNASQQYTNQMVERFQLSQTSMVGEIAANDGYLLQFFLKKNIPCFGVEPTKNTAAVAQKKGIKMFVNFFGTAFATQLAADDWYADLLVANNVLAHVPNINDFVSAFAILLKPQGVATFEFPHLYQLVMQKQFDTIYHEHFSYLSLSAVKRIFAENGLDIFDVEELSTHGGSLRIYAQRKDTGKFSCSERVMNLLQLEKNAGMDGVNFYTEFQQNILAIKYQLLDFLLTAKQHNEKVIAYGAAAKGNTLLNFSGIHADLLAYVIDKNPAKQHKFMPGSHLPIVSEERLMQDKPKWILILPWNLQHEIVEQLSYAREWGAKFVTAIPSLSIR
jgi:SAM-dependent methyltransferase